MEGIIPTSYGGNGVSNLSIGNAIEVGSEMREAFNEALLGHRHQTSANIPSLCLWKEGANESRTVMVSGLTQPTVE